MGPSEVNVKIEILRNHVDYHQTGFGNLMFELRRCPHEIDLHVEPRMTTNQWVHVAMHDDVFILFQAELKGNLLDVTSRRSGILSYPGLRTGSMDDEAYKFRHVRGPTSFVWPDDDLPTCLLIQFDVRDGVWMHLLGCQAYDMLMMSPPCPPWSKATSYHGCWTHA